MRRGKFDSTNWQQFDALPTELWSHLRWERVNCGFICSRERNEVLNFFQASLRNCINCVHCDDHFFIFISFPQFIYDLFHISLTLVINIVYKGLRSLLSYNLDKTFKCNQHHYYVSIENTRFTSMSLHWTNDTKNEVVKNKVVEMKWHLSVWLFTLYYFAFVQGITLRVGVAVDGDFKLIAKPWVMNVSKQISQLVVCSQ